MNLRQAELLFFAFGPSFVLPVGGAAQQLVLDHTDSLRHLVVIHWVKFRKLKELPGRQSGQDAAIGLCVRQSAGDDALPFLFLIQLGLRFIIGGCRGWG